MTLIIQLSTSYVNVFEMCESFFVIPPTVALTASIIAVNTIVKSQFPILLL